MTSNASGEPSPVVAVFAIENKGISSLSEPVLSRLSEYLTTLIAESGEYQVVPREELKRVFDAQKKDSPGRGLLPVGEEAPAH